VPVWDENRGRQNCDGSRAHNADRLLIRPASGRQAGTGLSDRTNHWKDTRQRIHSEIESRTKSTDTNLTNTPDGTAHTLTVRECPPAQRLAARCWRSGGRIVGRTEWDQPLYVLEGWRYIEIRCAGVLTDAVRRPGTGERGGHTRLIQNPRNRDLRDSRS
jgi:hypothetical protein